MKIGLLGYGKMGKTIEAIAIERGHNIAWKISKSNRAELNADLLIEADVVIEFTRPEFAVENINFCIDNKVPVVVGTTGWYSEFEEIKSRTLHNKAALFLYASPKFKSSIEGISKLRYFSTTAIKLIPGEDTVPDNKIAK